MPRVIITEPGKSPQPYRLTIESEASYIGRGADCDIQLEEGSVSTKHCVIKRVSGGFILEDLDSTNGIKTSNILHSVIDLENGSQAKIGDNVILDFTLTDEEIDILSSEEFKTHQKAQLPKIKEPVEDPKKQKEEVRENLEPPVQQHEPTQAISSQASKIKDFIGSIIFLILAVGALTLGFYIRQIQSELPPSNQPANQEELDHSAESNTEESISDQ